MAMHHGRPGLGGVNCAICDLFGRARHVRRFILCAARSGHGGGNKDFLVHRKRHDGLVVFAIILCHQNIRIDDIDFTYPVIYFSDHAKHTPTICLCPV